MKVLKTTLRFLHSTTITSCFPCNEWLYSVRHSFIQFSFLVGSGDDRPSVTLFRMRRSTSQFFLSRAEFEGIPSVLFLCVWTGGNEPQRVTTENKIHRVALLTGDTFPQLNDFLFFLCVFGGPNYTRGWGGEGIKIRIHLKYPQTNHLATDRIKAVGVWVTTEEEMEE